VNIKDKDGQEHNLKVEVLGSEETWNTPSLILVSSSSSSARIIFSQVQMHIHYYIIDSPTHCRTKF
jgi:biotin--protein ligase